MQLEKEVEDAEEKQKEESEKKEITNGLHERPPE